MNNVLSNPVTQHYLPKGRESAFVKPNHMIASSSSRNSSKNMSRFSSNDMVHNHYLEEAQKKTQEKDRISKTSVRPSAKSKNSTKSCKSKPRSNNQTSRVLPTSKSSCPTITAMPKADHSRNSSPFSDFKHFVCSTCHKCVFNANHDACITKLLKEIVTGHRFSPNKSSVVHEKPNSPRSCLRWKPTGRIFKTAGLRWIPTGKIFTSSTTMADREPPNSSNKDITNLYECEQTLNVSAGTLNLSAGISFNPKKERLRTTLQAPLLKEKKSVRFSALYLQKKRNLLGEAKTTSTPTSPTTQAQVTYVSESVSYWKLDFHNLERKLKQCRRVLGQRKIKSTSFSKERRLMRSFEMFVDGRLYEGDLRLLQRTI
ncbi:hypothetical protein Tco_1420427 [Tanacetum coccineum]